MDFRVKEQSLLGLAYHLSVQIHLANNKSLCFPQITAWPSFVTTDKEQTGNHLNLLCFIGSVSGLEIVRCVRIAQFDHKGNEASQGSQTELLGTQKGSF